MGNAGNLFLHSSLLLLSFSSTAVSGPLNEPMKFSVHYECEGSGCPVYILARGMIVTSTPQEFELFFSQLGFQPEVYFDSPGGELLPALQLGKAIRKAGLTTYVGGPYVETIEHQERTITSAAHCYSACVFAFVGGITRRVEGTGQIGVHQFRGAKNDVGEKSAQVAIAGLGAYLEEMGVDRRLLDAASVTDPETIFLVPRKLLQALNVDTSDPPKNAWRLEADERGQISLHTTQRQAYRDAVADLAIVRDGSRYIAYLRYRINQVFRSETAMRQIFSGRTLFRLHTSNGVTFDTETLSDWMVKDGSCYVAIGVSARAIADIARSSSFELRADWANATRDVDPSTEFGTEGFRNGAAALARR